MHFWLASSRLFCYTLNMLPLTIRRRTVTEDDLPEIKAMISAHWSKGRKQISRLLCQRWNWLQPNGELRDMACRELLLTLERKGLIRLPPPVHNGNNHKRNRTITRVPVDQSLLQGKLSDFPEPTLHLVRNTPLEPLYNSLIDRHHYLGYRQIVGAHLKYIAFLEDRPVACLGWGSGAWKVGSRDLFIGWDTTARKNNLHLIVNNVRFLVLPWIDIKCLASKVLALCIKRISSDWLKTYHYPIHLLETFVEKDRFRGTCYKAANWILVGQTKGIAKRGHKHLAHGLIKDVYLYPLARKFRKELCR